MNKLSEIDSKFNLIFSKRNYLFMLLGMAVILIGFILMTGSEANTKPDGVYDPNYWNDGIFSWRRTRLAPFFILLGFAIEVYAIFLNPNKQKAK